MTAAWPNSNIPRKAIVAEPVLARHANSQQPSPSPEPSGAAQFISNLNDRQKAHLQFALPAKDEPERFSQFLEGPRQTPVPHRFTFEALDSELRKARDSSSTRGPSRLGLSERSDTKSSKSSLRTKHTAEESDSEDERPSRVRSRHRRISSNNDARRSKPRVLGGFVGLRAIAATGADWRICVTAVCLCLLNLAVAWDATSVSINLPIIASQTHGLAIPGFWLGIAFFAAATTFLPIFTIFAEIFGRKVMILAAISLFTIGSSIAALSPTFTSLHVGRALQGIGAGGIFVLTDLITSDLLSALNRRRLSSAVGATWALGAVTGPVIGESIAIRGKWRWIFWINVPFGIISLIVISFAASLRGPSSGSILAKLKKFDWIGFVLLGGTIVSVCLGITSGGTLWAWSNPKTLLPLQFGLALMIAFGFWTHFSPFVPIISVRGFANRTILSTYFGTMIQGTVMLAFLWFLPFYFTVARPDLSDLGPGVRWLPWTVPLILMVLITFIVISRWNVWLMAIWLGWAIVLLGTGLTTICTRTSGTGVWIGSAVTLGIGLGILFPSLHTASELIAAHDEQQTRSAITNFAFFSFLGKTLGIALGTAVFENELRRQFSAVEVFAPFAGSYTIDSVALVYKIRAAAMRDPELAAMSADVYVKAMKMLWIILAVLIGLAFVNSLFMMPRKSREQGEVELENMDRTYVV